jgi:hypothetical protein
MARVSTPAEEAERAKADKARKANAHSPWHTHSTDQLQLFVFTAWQLIFQETPNNALLGLLLSMAANWHVADPEDFANQGPFLINRQEGTRLFKTMETAVAACNRAQPPGSLSPALVAQVKSNITQFFHLRAEAILPWCNPPAGTPHLQDVALIARAIVSQYAWVRRALDCAQQAIAELCAGRLGDAQMDNAAFLSIARPFYEAYLRNGMGHILASTAVKQALAFVPPPFLAAANGAGTRPQPGPLSSAEQPPRPVRPQGQPGGRASPARQRSPVRQCSFARHRSLQLPRCSHPPPVRMTRSRSPCPPRRPASVGFHYMRTQLLPLPHLTDSDPPGAPGL